MRSVPESILYQLIKLHVGGFLGCSNLALLLCAGQSQELGAGVLHLGKRLCNNLFGLQQLICHILIACLLQRIDAVLSLLNQLFRSIGVIDLYNSLMGTDIEYFRMIGTSGAVVLGMVYNYLPFMILPIYSVIIKLDKSLIEAARDLGANSFNVFRRVILPLSLPGVLSGITMVFVPSVSTFAISKMLGGGTQMMLGDLIEQQFLGGAYNPQLGAAISLVMMIIVVVCMWVMNRFGEGEEQAVVL